MQHVVGAPLPLPHGTGAAGRAGDGAAYLPQGAPPLLAAGLPSAHPPAGPPAPRTLPPAPQSPFAAQAQQEHAPRAQVPASEPAAGEPARAPRPYAPEAQQGSAPQPPAAQPPAAPEPPHAPHVPAPQPPSHAPRPHNPGFAASAPHHGNGSGHAPNAPTHATPPQQPHQPPAHPQHPHAQHPQPPAHPQHPQAQQPQHHQPPTPHHAPVPTGARDTTGHIQLPPGGPVALPAPPPSAAPAHAGTGGTTLAVLLIGPAGAGKTTVAKYWAQSRRVPTAHISLDDVREWVCSGFADPQAGWNDHSEAQYRLARRTCGFAARNFLANNISCIVDDAVFPDRPVVGLGGWKRHVGPGLLPVVLLPGLEVVLERNAKRSGNRRLSDEEVARIHGRMAGWYGSGLPIIDNSQYDVATTAQLLDETLARAVASPPTW